MAESRREWINRFVKWLEDEDMVEYGDDQEMRILAESFENEFKDCVLDYDTLIDGYRDYKWNKR